tara:strand:- start:55 stop:1626 length:1572 start_codon:yes stop_codon:yes gene_type:complete
MALTIEELRKAREKNGQKSLSIDDLKEARASNVQQTEDVPLADVPLTALKNIPGSAVELGKNIVTPILHPAQTAKDITSLGASIISVLKPGEQGNEQTARAVGEFLANRYGSLNSIKNTIAHDPVGILADVSILFTGGGSLAARAPGMVGKVGQGIKTVGQKIDPITGAIKTAGGVKNIASKATSNILGTTTGAGTEAIKGAYQAGKAGGATEKAFVENIRGKVPVEDVVPQAFEAIKEVGIQRGKAYKKGMKGAALDDIPINFNKVEDIVLAFDDAKSFKGVSELSKKAQRKLKVVYDLVDEWKANPDLHNAKGMDMLKRRIDAEYPTGINPGDSAVVITNIRNKIKNEIVKQAPAYEKVMKAYEEAITLEKQIMKELSLKKTAAAGTTLRKLQSVMRNNVNTNYGNRLEILKNLDPDLLPSLAGQALNTWTPRGLQSIGAGSVAAYGGLYDPRLLAGLPLQSPRLMGEFGLKAGQASRLANPFAEILSKYAAPSLPTTRLVGMLEEQIKEEELKKQGLFGN